LKMNLPGTKDGYEEVVKVGSRAHCTHPQ